MTDQNEAARRVAEARKRHAELPAPEVELPAAGAATLGLAIGQHWIVQLPGVDRHMQVTITGLHRTRGAEIEDHVDAAMEPTWFPIGAVAWAQLLGTPTREVNLRIEPRGHEDFTRMRPDEIAAAVTTHRMRMQQQHVDEYEASLNLTEAVDQAESVPYVEPPSTT